MYTESETNGDSSFYIESELIKDDSFKDISDLENKISLYNTKKYIVCKRISYEKNLLARNRYSKQKLAKKIILLYFALGMSIIFIPISVLQVIIAVLYTCFFAKILDISDNLNKKSRIECNKKVNKMRSEVNKYNLEIANLKKEIKQLKEKEIVAKVEIHGINQVDELKKIRETYLNDNNSIVHNKTYKKQK